MKPAAAKGPSRPTDKKRPDKPLLAGDLICGTCGEGNTPSRNFCSRCGSSLASAEVVQEKWWRRLIPRRRKKQRAAGERGWKSSTGARKRPAWKRVLGKVRPIITFGLLGLSLLYGVAPGLRDRINEPLFDLRDRVEQAISPELNPLSPARASSTTSSFPGNLPEQAIDGGINTTWIADGNQGFPTLVVTFATPVDIDQIIVRNGIADGFKDFERPRVLLFVYDTGGTSSVELSDQPDPQTIDVDNGKEVNRVDIQVVSTYPSLQSLDIALSEIEFFGQN